MMTSLAAERTAYRMSCTVGGPLVWVGLPEEYFSYCYCILLALDVAAEVDNSTIVSGQSQLDVSLSTSTKRIYTSTHCHSASFQGESFGDIILREVCMQSLTSNFGKSSQSIAGDEVSKATIVNLAPPCRKPLPAV